MDANNFASIISLIQSTPGAITALYYKKAEPEADTERMRALGGLTLVEWESQSDLICEKSKEDLWFGLNACTQGKRNTGHKLRHPLRKLAQIKHLNAVCIDLDVGRPDGPPEAQMSQQEALQAVYDAVIDGIIPMPTFYVYSGRGLYIVWMLHDKNDPSKKPETTDETRASYGKVSEKLTAMFSHLAADKANNNATRLLRVPGSINTKNGQRVMWHIWPNEAGQLASYSLEELAEGLGIQAQPAAQTEPKRIYPETPKGQRRYYGKPIIKRHSARNRVNGAYAKSNYAAHDLEVIAAARGGWNKGSRWHRLTIYAQLLHDTKENISMEEVEASVKAMAQQCQPPFPSDASDGTVKQIVETTFGPDRVAYPLNFANLAKRLNVTEEEAKRLGLRSILPEKLRAERTKKPKTTGRPERQEARLKAIQAIVEAQPNASAADIQKALKSKRITTTKRTVERNLKALFPNRQKAKSGRPATAATEEKTQPGTVLLSEEQPRVVPPHISISVAINLPDNLALLSDKILLATSEEERHDRGMQPPETVPVTPVPWKHLARVAT